MTIRQAISAERVLQLIDAYGSDPAGWPEAERDAAQVLLREQPDAFAEAIADAEALEALIASERVPDVPAGLAERILEQAPRPRAGADRQGGGVLQALGRFVFPGGARWPAGATLAALVMGVSAGLATAPASAGADYESAEEQVLYAALGFDSYDAYAPEASE